MYGTRKRILNSSRFIPRGESSFFTSRQSVTNTRVFPYHLNALNAHSTPISFPQRLYFHNPISNHTFSTTATTSTPLSSSANNLIYETDFFGEPITLFSTSNTITHSQQMEILQSMNQMMLAITSKGQSCSGGGDEYGLSTMAAHSSAQTWKRLLEYLNQYPKLNTEVPMIVILAIMPVLVQAGIPYTKHLDSVVMNNSVSIYETAQQTVDYFLKNDQKSNDEWIQLSPREQYHLHTLSYILQSNLRGAQCTLQTLLQFCPGDALALSLLHDLNYRLGDAPHSHTISGSVASYWKERDHRHFITSSPSSSQPSQYALGSSHVALGWALGDGCDSSEQLVAQIPSAERFSPRKKAVGISTFALSILYEKEGRSSEGVSLLTKDGAKQYEDCGFLFFDSKLAGYGARFSLDRNGAASDHVALRIYDSYFQRILEYWMDFPEEWEEDHGVDGRIDSEMENKERGVLRAPKRTRSQMMEEVRGTTNSFFQSLFRSNESKAADSSTMKGEEEKQSKSMDTEIGLEDVLTWLPPTPQLFVDATLLLLRLTLSEGISPQDTRWKKLRLAWIHFIEIMSSYQNPNDLYSDYPMVKVLSHLFLPPPIIIPGNDHETTITQVSQGLHQLSQLLHLGLDTDSSECKTPPKTPLQQQHDWKQVVHHLSCLHGTNLSTLSPPITPHPTSTSQQPILHPHYHSIQTISLGYDIEIRPIAEHALCYAALQSKDYHSLNLARAIGSAAVSLRQNCPEAWWRYSCILEELGDNVAAQDARNASLSLGAGEGGKGAH